MLHASAYTSLMAGWNQRQPRQGFCLDDGAGFTFAGSDSHDQPRTVVLLCSLDNPME